MRTKPYEPDGDQSRAGNAGAPRQRLSCRVPPRQCRGVAVEWAESVRRRIPELEVLMPAGMPAYTADELSRLVGSLVVLDQRPVHQRGGTGEWAMRLLGFVVKIRMPDVRETIVALE